MSGNEGAVWTPEMIKARLIGAFACDRLLPREGPLSPENADDRHTGTRAAAFNADSQSEFASDDITPDCRQKVRDPCPPDEFLEPAQQDYLARLQADNTAIVRPWRRTTRWESSGKGRSITADDRKIRVDTREDIRGDPTPFAKACERDNAIMTRVAPHNEVLLMHDMLDLIVEDEADPRVERARQIVMCFLRSGLTANKFCEAKGLWRNSLRYALDTYCSALAARLNRLKLPPRRAEWRIYINSSIIFGLDEIAKASRHSAKTTLRWIERDKLPVGQIAGQYCADREMLETKCYRGRKPAAEPKAPFIDHLITGSTFGLSRLPGFGRGFLAKQALRASAAALERRAA